MFTEVEHQRNGLDLIKIDNDQAKIIFSNFGARIVSWKYEDNNIVLGNVVEADEYYHEIHITSAQVSVVLGTY